MELSETCSDASKFLSHLVPYDCIPVALLVTAEMLAAAVSDSVLASLPERAVSCWITYPINLSQKASACLIALRPKNHRLALPSLAGATAVKIQWISLHPFLSGLCRFSQQKRIAPYR
jgi:hypothetical protein